MENPRVGSRPRPRSMLPKAKRWSTFAVCHDSVFMRRGPGRMAKKEATKPEVPLFDRLTQADGAHDEESGDDDERVVYRLTLA